ncbi:MAG TPA: preprotein translocase subunit SecE [Actinomycetota bacterium]|nr:preprotein translocase subunit SecE [Actinomycetota bacterium]
MNREIKRRMKRDQKAAERQAARGRPPVAPQQLQKRERVGMKQWIREIVAELRRVIWPSRQEVITYSIVVVVVVSLLTGIVFLMDIGFSEAVITLFRPAGGG